MLRQHSAWLAVIVSLSLVALADCKSSNTPTQPTPDVTLKDDPSFASDIQAIFSANCALSGCHNASAASGLVLSQGLAYANLVNVKSSGEPAKIRVIPNDATNSYLVIKIEGRQSVGGRMPLSASALSANRIQNIKNWINRGAKDN